MVNISYKHLIMNQEGNDLDVFFIDIIGDIE